MASEKEKLHIDKPVALAYHPSFLQHDTGPGHPESQQRLEAIISHLRTSDLWNKLMHISPEPAELSTIGLIHPKPYIELIRQACLQGPSALDTDTVVSKGSWDAALRAVGAVTQSVDEVIAGRCKGVFCAVRPPGHHALPTRAMGFCLFNNVAIGVRHAQKHHKLSRVLIVDWDVHHGNATQFIFYEDPSVFYFSSHQFPYYPGTGSIDEQGKGKGTGLNVNIPLEAGSSDHDLIEAFEKKLLPRALEFKPELVFISAGFDGHKDDPLANINMTESGYAKLTEQVLEITNRCCPGRLVSVLEGGYHLQALSRSVEAHLRALLD